MDYNIGNFYQRLGEVDERMSGAATPVAEFARLIDEVVKSGRGLEDELLDRIAGELAKIFSVQADEVAILAVAQHSSILSFLYPPGLRNVGSLPMSTTNSLAVRTVRDKRPEMINNFPAQKHPTVFEAVALTPAAERHPIQKIMSVPLLLDGRPVGALQVSRKGKSPAVAGADFTLRDLTALVSAASIFAKCFRK